MVPCVESFLCDAQINAKSKNMNAVPPDDEASSAGPKLITAEEFDRRFDAGEDMSDYIDWEHSEILEPELERLEVELPRWVIAGLEKEAAKLGTTREAVLRERITEVFANAHS